MGAYLILETGHVFAGEWIGQPKQMKGEVVFNTSMTGYQGVLTDPSYGGQIVTFTYPLIGNCGIRAHEGESDRPQVAGVVVGEVAPFPTPNDAAETLAEYLDRYGVAGITGIDTCAVTTVVREHGPVRGVITGTSHQPLPTDWPNPVSAEWVQHATVKEPVTLAGQDPTHIVLLDYGYKKSLAQWLQSCGCHVTVVPYDWPVADLLKLAPDGIVLSNGPGDPQALRAHADTIAPLLRANPTMGIGIGHQVAALAFGAGTERAPHAHRGSNHPVKNQTNGQVWLTSQHHGYVVKRSSLVASDWDVTYVNVNDGSVEGLRHTRYPLQSVQFHPVPDTTEAAYLLDGFLAEVESFRKETAYA